MISIIPLDWDSKFFGLSIAKAVVTSEEDASILSGQAAELSDRFDLIYVFSESDLRIPIENACLVDRKAVFSLNGPTLYNADKHIKSWESLETTESLVSLALVSGKHSRFKIDTHFPAGSYERLYTQWIKQSVNKNIATEVFCYMIDECPRGLLTLDRRDGRNTIGLVAVDEDYRHRGIGTAMVEYAVSYVKEHDGGEISVTTQLENEAACQLYSRCGFSLKSVTDIWHWWL